MLYQCIKKQVGKVGPAFRHCQGPASGSGPALWQGLANGDDLGVDQPHLPAFLRLLGKADSGQHTAEGTVTGRAQEYKVHTYIPVPPTDPWAGERGDGSSFCSRFYFI